MSRLYVGQLQGRVIRWRAHRSRCDLASGYLLHSDKLKLATCPAAEAGERTFIVIEDSAP